jgi:dienelactone hydrolase
MKHAFIFFISLFIIYGCAEKNGSGTNQPASEESSIVTKEVTYTADGTMLKGFLAYDSSTTAKRPGIIVVHEWWGLTNYEKRRAMMLAKLGYVAFAIDMYGNGKIVDNPKDAGQSAAAAMHNMDTATAKFDAGLKILKEQPQTDTSKLAAIGYCFGGGVVLNMALHGADLDGVVSFHGDLPTSKVAHPKNVKAKVLVCTGEADPFNPPKKVNAFEKAMNMAKVDYKVIKYPNAKHAFTNPAADSLGKKFNLPIAYNQQADEKSWDAMQKFFDGLFK